MSILIKGKDFSPTEQVTSTKLDELVDNASFTDTSANAVAYTGTTGTCLLGGGLEVTSLGQLQIADSGVNTSELSDSSVTTAKINNSAVTTVKIANSNVTTAKIADDAVTQAKIANDAVGADQLASNAVVTDSIVNLNVTTDKIANANITTSKIADLNVTTGKIANTSITTGKIIDANVTTAKIADANVTTAKIAADAITTEKIADDVGLGGNPTTTTQAASDNSTRIATTSYVTSGIANALTGSGGIFGTIDQTADSNPKIFSKNSSGDYDSVAPSGDVAMTQAGAFTIQDDAVTTAKIINNAITTAKITDSNVTTAKIADSNVTKAKIENVANLKVLGNTSGSAAAPQEVTINDTDTMNDASATTLATSESIKAYVDTEIDKTIGQNQTWQLVTRAVDSTEYTNDTGKPIMVNGSFSGNTDSHVVYISIKPSGGSYVEFVLARSTNSGGGVVSNGSTIVPVNSVYKFRKTGDTITSETFHELR